jgi:hypothetical protein
MFCLVQGGLSGVSAIYHISTLLQYIPEGVFSWTKKLDLILACQLCNLYILMILRKY